MKPYQSPSSSATVYLLQITHEMEGLAALQREFRLRDP